MTYHTFFLGNNKGRGLLSLPKSKGELCIAEKLGKAPKELASRLGHAVVAPSLRAERGWTDSGKCW